MEGTTRKDAALSLWPVAVLWLVYLLFGAPMYLEQMNFVSAVTHHFFHANILHIAINSYALFVLLMNGRKRYIPGTNAIQFSIAWVIGSLAYAVSPVPALGVSDMLYAVIGLRCPSFRERWWRTTNTIIFLVVMFAYLFVPHVSAITHIASFCGGVAVAALIRFIYTTNSDYGKAKGRR